jgi:hypothetical protein
MLTVNSSLLSSTSTNSSFRVSFLLDAATKTTLQSGITGYKVRVDMPAGLGAITPTSVRVLGDSVAGSLFYVDPAALGQGIVSVAGLSPTEQVLDLNLPLIQFDVSQPKLTAVNFTVKELIVNSTNFLLSTDNPVLPVSFGLTISRSVPSSAGSLGLYEANGMLLVAPAGYQSGQTLLDKDVLNLKDINGVNFNQDIITGYSPSSLGTYLNHFRILFKSDKPLASGSYGFKTLDFDPQTGIALVATPAGISIDSGTPTPITATAVTDPSSAEFLTYEQYKELLPNVIEADVVTQQKVGNNYLLSFYLSDGTPFTKLVGLPESPIRTTLAQAPLSLDATLPSDVSLSVFGPESSLTNLQASTYLNSLVNMAFPSANDYSRSIKAAIDALSQLGSSNAAVKVVSTEGSADNEDISLIGADLQSEILVLNLWPSSETSQINIANTERAMVVGDGTITHVGNSSVYLAGDGANQILSGGPADDYLYSGGGYDALIGGGGTDTFHVTRKGHVAIQDFESMDKLHFSFLGVTSLMDLVNRITGVKETPDSVTYTFDSELELTLVGYSLYSPYPESMFILG